MKKRTYRHKRKNSIRKKYVNIETREIISDYEYCLLNYKQQLNYQLKTRFYTNISFEDVVPNRTRSQR